jgi:hypothetical protein
MGYSGRSMKTQAVGVPDVQLSPPDGVIVRALADLETKVTAWTTAAASVQNRIAAQAAGPAGPGSAGQVGGDAIQTSPSPTPQVEGHDTGTASFTAPVGFAEPGSAEAAAKIEVLRKAMGTEAALGDALAVADEIDAPDSTSPADEYTEAEAALLASLEPAMANAVRARRRLMGDQVSLRELIGYENEALLGSLEPEVANLIRVRYRLFDGRKTTKQLIEEYRQEPVPEQEPESWLARLKKGASAW